MLRTFLVPKKSLSSLQQSLKSRSASIRVGYAPPLKTTILPRRNEVETNLEGYPDSYINRNPLNCQYYGRYKPKGYSTQRFRKDFNNRLEITLTNRHIIGSIIHYDGTVLVSASTKEFAIAKHLYKTTDVSAAVNIARVLARRSLEAGIKRVFWQPRWKIGKERVFEFQEKIQDGGLILWEAKSQYITEQCYTFPDERPPRRKTHFPKTKGSKKNFTNY